MTGTRQRVHALFTRQSGRSFGRPGLVIVIVAAVLAVTFATGYTTTRALTGDDSAWLRKGVTIAHINGPSARYDAAISGVRLAASASDQVQVVQDPDGQVYTADPATRKIFRMDLATMTALPGPSGTGVLAAGSTMYIVDRTLRTLTPVDAQLHAIGPPIHIPAPIQSETIASDGTVYVGQQDGAVTIVRNRRAQTVQVAPKGDALWVTVVGTRAEAVDPQNGKVYSLDGGQPSLFSLPGPVGGPVSVGANQPDGPLWLTQGNVLVRVDLSNGQTRSVPLADEHHFGVPLTNGGRVYVPDDTAGQVLVLDAATLAPAVPIAVPPGAPGATDIELIAKDHQVWIDNPTSRDGKVADPSGNVRTVDKGTGDQVVDPNAAPAPPSPAPPTGAPAPDLSPVTGVAPAPVPSPSLTSSPAPSPIPGPSPGPGGV
ncbi:MAG: hypothetical protein M3Y36_11080, partial [Actinomycetota bacterium]|nr:hypothetical protein [Actinomycetota bacterium]